MDFSWMFFDATWKIYSLWFNAIYDSQKEVYPTHYLELASVVFALMVWRNYL